MWPEPGSETAVLGAAAGDSVRCGASAETAEFAVSMALKPAILGQSMPPAAICVSIGYGRRAGICLIRFIVLSTI
jgi:hypothetical protein